MCVLPNSNRIQGLIVVLNPLKTSPEYTRAGVYGKCVL